MVRRSDVEVGGAGEETRTHHPADGATDGVGLELTVKAPGHLVDLQEEEQRMGTGSSGRNLAKIKRQIFCEK